MIDVIFFLLATFVLFALALNRIQSLPVALPASGRPLPNPPDLVTIQVSDRGNLYWNQELLDVAELPGRLAHFMETAKAPRVLVAGDDRADWATTIRVLDQVRAAGIGAVSMETRVRPTGR